jgi:hypothetical protein
VLPIGPIVHSIDERVRSLLLDEIVDIQVIVIQQISMWSQISLKWIGFLVSWNHVTRSIAVVDVTLSSALLLV